MFWLIALQGAELGQHGFAKGKAGDEKGAGRVAGRKGGPARRKAKKAGPGRAGPAGMIDGPPWLLYPTK